MRTSIFRVNIPKVGGTKSARFRKWYRKYKADVTFRLKIQTNGLCTPGSRTGSSSPYM